MLSKWKTLRRNFKLIDIFGNQISFSYNYNEIYKTYEGATMTVIIVLLLIVGNFGGHSSPDTKSSSVGVYRERT